MIMKSIKLNDGNLIPQIGYGTYQAPEGDVAISSVQLAIEMGYRHIDAAALYGNEVSVGEGIKRSGVDRAEIFVTSKVWNTDRGYDRTIRAFERTLSDLGLDYLDLYLIHWPANAMRFPNWKEINIDTWRALEDLKKQGKVKSIGVCNFMVNQLEPLLEEAEIQPAVNQIEFHPGHTQKEVVDFCQSRGIVIEGWSPLGVGKLIGNEVLVSIAKNHNRSTAQVALRWAVQHNVIPLPKSVTPSRMKENMNVFDFELSSEEMKMIDQMPSMAFSGFDPNRVTF